MKNSRKKFEKSGSGNEVFKENLQICKYSRLAWQRETAKFAPKG